jgi:enhancing lycopene biosynthesis protein 2
MKFAVILSGCGVYDGAEIHESTLSLLAIARKGGEYKIFAPDVKQHHVINHITGEEMEESRNVMIEAARIARGDIQSLDDYDPANFDALVIPGGFGVAKNLCTYAFDGPLFSVDKIVEKKIKETHALKVPIGALCISPVLIAKILGKADLTIGSDDITAGHIEELGGVHISARNGEIVVDTDMRIVTNPCYMNEASISDIADGAAYVVQALIELVEK